MPEEQRKAGVPQRFRVLGIDPGTRVVGYGVVDFLGDRRPVMVSSGAIRAGRGDIPNRLRRIFDGLREVIARARPDVVALEEVFYGKSISSALRMGEGRGVAILSGAQAGLEVVEYPAAVVKQAITGNGRAGKVQVQEMIMRLLELEEIPETLDVTDALAIALCHGYRHSRRTIRQRGGGN